MDCLIKRIIRHICCLASQIEVVFCTNFLVKFVNVHVIFALGHRARCKFLASLLVAANFGDFGGDGDSLRSRVPARARPPVAPAECGSDISSRHLLPTPPPGSQRANGLRREAQGGRGWGGVRRVSSSAKHPQLTAVPAPNQGSLRGGVGTGRGAGWRSRSTSPRATSSPPSSGSFPFFFCLLWPYRETEE